MFEEEETEEEKKRRKWRLSDELETSSWVSLKRINVITRQEMDRRRVDRKTNVDEISPGRCTATLKSQSQRCLTAFTPAT